MLHTATGKAGQVTNWATSNFRASSIEGSYGDRVERWRSWGRHGCSRRAGHLQRTMALGRREEDRPGVGREPHGRLSRQAYHRGMPDCRSRRRPGDAPLRRGSRPCRQSFADRSHPCRTAPAPSARHCEPGRRGPLFRAGLRLGRRHVGIPRGSGARGGGSSAGSLRPLRTGSSTKMARSGVDRAIFSSRKHCPEVPEGRS